MLSIKEILWVKEEKKHRKVDSKNIKAFNTAVYAIKDFIYFKDWEKAFLWIEEIRKKEQKGLETRMKWKSAESKEYKEELKKVTERLWTLDRLSVKLKKEKEKYEHQLENKKLKERLANVEERYNLYINSKKFDEAMIVINKFLEDFPSNDKVINYVSKKKKELKKNQNKKKGLKWLSLIEETKRLLWDSVEENEINKATVIEKESSLDKVKEYFNNLSYRKQKRLEKQLIDEVEIMMKQRWDNIDSETKEKLSNIHKWLAKEIWSLDMIWYDFFWKIMWADKISWDTFWEKETKDFHRFFIWDATWHWVKAWLMISVLSNKFEEFWDKENFQEVVKELNNALKQELQSWNFVTSIFFQIDKKEYEKIKFIWMGHEPMFVYRAKTHTVEKVIPWGLAAWIRVAKNTSFMKIKDLILEDGDVMLSYSDWIAEAKSPTWEMYSFDRIKQSLKQAAQKHKDTKKIYNQMIEDVKEFHWWTKFDDDLTIILLKRNKEKDLIQSDDEVAEIMNKFNIDKNTAKKYKWKPLHKIKEWIEKKKKKQEYERIRRVLKDIYLTWDFLKLKEETTRYIKEWYIHKDLNFYLRKANDNELKQKIKMKNEKIMNKYNVLKWLYSKWDYESVISECQEIIAKDWNI